eukprot:gene6810-9326_t
MIPFLTFLIFLLTVTKGKELWGSTPFDSDEVNLPTAYFQLQLNQTPGYAVDSRTRRRLASNSVEFDSYSDNITPLYQGMGTHYSFLWIGTPPQRVSVIVDTGSHHTAFPCVGCKCGKHMDPHFDPKKSSSSKIKECGSPPKKCFFRQSYSEGSSWHAFKVMDKVWVGSQNFNELQSFDKWTVNFDFGCQDSETGLFRTQNVDGIMGMSAADDTLPYQLMRQQKTKTKIFTMCFRIGGGTMTLGGVDPSMNNNIIKNSIVFARLIKPKGWYTVKVIDVFMRNPKTMEIKSIGGPIFKFNNGKGTIVDSGTTDTYLPSALQSQFKSLYTSIAKMPYGNSAIEINADQFASLPTIIYRLLGLQKDSYIDVECPPSSYLEAFKNKKYSPRIYLTEQTGAVLGANFMNGHNVIFDPDGLKIGFVKSDCLYQTNSNNNKVNILNSQSISTYSIHNNSNKMYNNINSNNSYGSALHWFRSNNITSDLVSLMNNLDTVNAVNVRIRDYHKKKSNYKKKMNHLKMKDQLFMTENEQSIHQEVTKRLLSQSGYDVCKTSILDSPCSAECSNNNYNKNNIQGVYASINNQNSKNYKNNEIIISQIKSAAGIHIWNVPNCLYDENNNIKSINYVQKSELCSIDCHRIDNNYNNNNDNIEKINNKNQRWDQMKNIQSHIVSFHNKSLLISFDDTWIETVSSVNNNSDNNDCVQKRIIRTTVIQMDVLPTITRDPKRINHDYVISPVIICKDSSCLYTIEISPFYYENTNKSYKLGIEVEIETNNNSNINYELMNGKCVSYNSFYYIASNLTNKIDSFISFVDVFLKVDKTMVNKLINFEDNLSNGFSLLLQIPRESIKVFKYKNQNNSLYQLWHLFSDSQIITLKYQIKLLTSSESILPHVTSSFMRRLNEHMKSYSNGMGNYSNNSVNKMNVVDNNNNNNNVELRRMLLEDHISEIIHSFINHPLFLHVFPMDSFKPNEIWKDFFNSFAIIKRNS